MTTTDPQHPWRREPDQPGPAYATPRVPTGQTPQTPADPMRPPSVPMPPAAGYPSAPPYPDQPNQSPSQASTGTWHPKTGCPFGEAVSRFWHGYVQFDGRSSRSEYWFATLFCILCAMGASLIPFVGTLLWGLAALLPGIAIVVRRLHDLNLSGWWYAVYYGLCTVVSIPMIVGMITMIGASSDHMPAPGWAMPLLAGGGLASLALGVAWIVLMCQPSDPRGARFDR